jgi:ribosomal protein S18 acetylase RimI-like enzyme
LKQIVLDKWLSELMGKPAYNLQGPHEGLVKQDLPKGEMFIGAKIPVEDIAELVHLQKLGFYVVDTNIQLSLIANMEDRDNTNVRFAEPGDEQAIRVLARSAFKHNRFHRDLQIPDEVACKIKEEWAGNYFSGKRGRWMVVAECQARVAGFLQLLSKNNDTIVIDLIAVDEESRGNGLAKAMISYAFINCLGRPAIVDVGTQIANTTSLALYTKLGFRINSASYVLHMHQ